MKQSSKERLATLLMDELLERLSARESIRRMLGEMTSRPIDEVIEHLLAEFEQSVEAYHRSFEEQVAVEQLAGEAVVGAAHDDDSREAVLLPVEKTGEDHAEHSGALPASDEIPVEIGEPSTPEDPVPFERETPSAPPEDRESASPRESVGPETHAPEPTVQLDPIQLDFPKINLRVDLPEPAPPVQEQRQPAPARKSITPRPTEEIHPEPEPRDEKKDVAGMKTQEPSLQPKEQQHPSPGKKSIQPQMKEEALPEPKPRAQEKEPVRIDTTESSSPAKEKQHPGPAKKSAPSVPKEDAESKSGDQEKELRKLEELARKIEAEYESRRTRQKETKPGRNEHAGGKTDSTQRTHEPADAEFIESTDIDEHMEEMTNVDSAGPGKHIAHARYAFADDEYVYVHAVGRIPSGEEPSRDPFMLEEKGIDGKGFAFALDYDGLRFYLSKLNPSEVNISRSLVLLLNKQESLQMQGVHESTLNDLRGHGILLPMEFGTVARGKDYLLGIIDKNKEDLDESLEQLEKTTWWTVTASMLDNTIAGIVGTDVQHVGRERPRDRASYTSAPLGKKFDIKVLERILQREKKIAEAIHAELSKIIERADVDTIIGLGSGYSEDWKVILKASYEVSPRDLARFSRAVTDLQYHHLQYDLMLALTGDKDYLTLRKK